MSKNGLFLTGTAPAWLEAMLRHALVALFATAAAVACGSSDDGSSFASGVKEPDDVKAGPSGKIDATGTAPTGSKACGKIDLLFVIDDSASMAEEQESLIAAFPEFIEQVAATNNGTLDYRVAITTTSSSVVCDAAVGGIGPEGSVAADGELVEDATCGMTQPWLSRADTDVKDAFGCAADVGVSGASNEMPLLGMQRALEKAHANGRFLRDDALLAVVFLTDEDDHSTRKMHYTTLSERDDDVSDVDSFGTFLDGLKQTHGRWATAVIAGDGDCESSFGKAKDAPRLHDFAALAGKHGSTSSICAGDLGVSLREVLATFQTACADFPSDVK